MLLHGNGAHAGWWRFIAPYSRRSTGSRPVGSGHGRLDWREAYDLDTFADEIEAGGGRGRPVRGGMPVMVGHSFGCFPMLTEAEGGNPGAGAAP